MKRLVQLVDMLSEADNAYHNYNTEIMPNVQYDKLYDELVKLEEETGIILSKSPTIKVGYDVLSSLPKVAHNIPLLSLDKTKEIDKLVSFLEEKEGILSYKLDGLTIVLTYDNGKLIQALTRGNGTVGEDVTHNAMHFGNVPHTIPYKSKLIIRGEAIITYREFEKINKTLSDDEQYKNPRNLCSGTVRQLDSAILSKRNVQYYAFAVMESNENFTKKSQALQFLNTQGFTSAHYENVLASNVSNTVNIFKENVKELNVPTDGLVLTYDDISYSDSLGTTAKFPKDSIAFKWQDAIATTKLINIQWNTSRTGLINPIAIFETVELEGTEVRKASLHNLSIVEDLKLGYGDEITVYKANMIIPQVLNNLTRTGPIQSPLTCNKCDGKTKIKEENGVKTLHCTNSTSCEAQLIKSLTHYVSRNAMNIEGLSEATLSKFVQKGFIKNFSHIYDLQKHKEEILQMANFGEKSVKNMFDSIIKSKNTTLSQFIYALGIFNVGQTLAKLLCNNFNNDFNKIRTATEQEILEIDGFGEVIASTIVDYFSTELNLKIINSILPHLNFSLPIKKEDETLKDLTFVITGNVEKFKNRNELQLIIESKNGKVTNSVTKNTSYLINSDVNSTSSKNKSAIKLNIPIITENDFIQMFITC